MKVIKVGFCAPVDYSGAARRVVVASNQHRVTVDPKARAVVIESITGGQRVETTVVPMSNIAWIRTDGQ